MLMQCLCYYYAVYGIFTLVLYTGFALRLYAASSLHTAVLSPLATILFALKPKLLQPLLNLRTAHEQFPQ